jgi:hypothetical protein
MQQPAERIAHELDACYDELRRLGVHVSNLPANKNLIITTGDISDVDGFFALAKYALTGADVLFVMNYPAWVGCERSDNRLADGLGFTYTCNEFMRRNFEEHSAAKVADVKKNDSFTAERKSEEMERINDTRRKYHSAAARLGINLEKSPLHTSTAECMRAFDMIAFTFAEKVWNETTMPPGRTKGALYYCRGGVNDVSPFSLPSTKNEIVVYAEQINENTMKEPVGLAKGAILKANESNSILWNDILIPESYTRVSAFLLRYEAICMDFNGSMAFLDGVWITALEEAIASGKLKGVFVMGGCLTEEPLQTKKLPFLNRMACATMNQLYHPGKTAQFFDFIRMKNVNVFVAPNTIIKKFPSDPIAFLHSNGIHSPFLESITTSYYASQYFVGDKKPYDLYTAVAVERFICGHKLDTTPKRMWYDSIYGCTLVSDLVEHRIVVQQMQQRLGITEGPNWQTTLVTLLRLACMHVHMLNFHLESEVLHVNVSPAGDDD